MSITRHPTYQLLAQEFPTLFNEESCFDLSFGDGWLPLVKEALAVLAQEPETKVAQIKEKFGGLRLYGNNISDAGHAAIHKAEDKSFTVCEDCGQPGKTRRGGWMRTLCDSCHKANEEAKEKRYEELRKR